MITSEIKFSQMEDRMDAEYYKPQYIEIDDVLSGCKTRWEKLDNIVDKVVNGIEIRKYVKKGIPYLRVGDILDLFPDLANVEHVSHYSKVKKDVILNIGDILISRSGTLGLVSLVSEELNHSIISSHIIRISQQKLNSSYLAIFLKCKYGQLQILQRNNGGVVPEINQPALKSIKFPIPSPSFQSHIESLATSAYKKRKEAQKKLQEAEKILEKELGWRELELNHDKAFETSFSHLERRFDPEYFKPRYERIKEVLISKGAKPLSEAVKVITKRADFRKTPDKLIKYVAIADIDPESSQIISHTEIPAYQAPSRATYEIKEGYILTAISGNSTGTKRHASCFVTKKEDGFICTNGLVPLLPKEGTEPLYLLFYLKSPFFLEQVRRELTGAAIPAISLEDVKQVLVYLPSLKIQKEIAKLMEASNQLRIESRDLIDQAKGDVEEMVEKGNYKD